MMSNPNLPDPLANPPGLPADLPGPHANSPSLPANPPGTEVTKKQRKERHVFTNERKLTFLKIVDLLRPFEAKYGTVTASWQKVAMEYNSVIQKEDALGSKSAKQ